MNEEVIVRMDKANTIVAELVRCRDCKHVTYKINPVRAQDVFYGCPYSAIRHDGDFYCAYGERIEE